MVSGFGICACRDARTVVWGGKGRGGGREIGVGRSHAAAFHGVPFERSVAGGSASGSHTAALSVTTDDV